VIADIAVIARERKNKNNRGDAEKVEKQGGLRLLNTDGTDSARHNKSTAD